MVAVAHLEMNFDWKAFLNDKKHVLFTTIHEDIMIS